MTERRLRMLCLDGGGVRGLASLYLLKQILAHVGDRKPCDFFDMICGTSTGGLIAIMLGRLEMTVDDCIDAFTGMMDAVFQKKHTIPFKLFSRNIQSRFDTDTLKEKIKEVIEKAGYHREELMRGPKRSGCKVFVVALAGEARTVVHLTDYRKPAEQSNFYNGVKIWEAARATSAATSFFAPMDISRDGMTRRYWDGAFGANNPVDELWVEAQEVFGPSPLEPQIRGLLSIGTGRPPLTAFGKSVIEVGRSIIQIATQTQKTANMFPGMHVDLANRDGYFRFNPPDISEVGLEDASKRSIIAVRTDEYGKDHDVRARMLKFEQVVGDDQKRADPLILRTRARMEPMRFYDLGKSAKYIRPSIDSYWRHLTLPSHEIYEAIYLDCKPYHGRVYLSSFLRQFNGSDPSPKMVEEVWRRLLRDKTKLRDSYHPKGFVMAVLYMLHIEKYFPSEQPQDEDRVFGAVHPERRELLKRYGNWVGCQCNLGCGMEWNFANDIGMHRGESGKQKCAMFDAFKDRPFRNILDWKEQEALLHNTRVRWQGSTPVQ